MDALLVVKFEYSDVVGVGDGVGEVDVVVGGDAVVVVCGGVVVEAIIVVVV